jgi:hypothetical protein
MTTLSKIKNKFDSFTIWWVTYVPPFLIFIALIWLITSSLQNFKDEALSKQIIVFYLSGIGLSISLASSSFSYARVCEESNKSQVVLGGEHFLHAALLLITALLINWLVMEGRNFFDNYTALKKIKFLLSSFIGFSYLFAVIAARYIVRGMWELDKVLFKKTMI